MSSETEHLAASLCRECNRKGFIWGRGYCQYCGHKQYPDQDVREEVELYPHECRQEAFKDYRAPDPIIEDTFSIWPPLSLDIDDVDFDF